MNLENGWYGEGGEMVRAECWDCGGTLWVNPRDLILKCWACGSYKVYLLPENHKRERRIDHDKGNEDRRVHG